MTGRRRCMGCSGLSLHQASREGEGLCAVQHNGLIMLVDGDREFHKSFKSALPRHLSLVSAYNPSEALAIASKRKLRGVVLSLHTPLSFVGGERSPGLDMLQRIRYCSDERLPVVAVVDSDIGRLLREYIMTWADGIIRKAGDMRAFVHDVEKCLMR